MRAASVDALTRLSVAFELDSVGEGDVSRNIEVIQVLSKVQDTMLEVTREMYGGAESQGGRFQTGRRKKVLFGAVDKCAPVGVEEQR